MKLREKIGNSISVYDLEGSLLGVVGQLQSLYDNHKDNYEELELEAEDERDYYDSYMVFNLMGIREETEEDKKKRLESAKRYKKAIEERERKEYERLKKMFEPGKRKKPTERDEKRYKVLKKKAGKKK